MKERYAALALCAALATGHAALGFGTVRGLGQNAEHERITLHALACGLTGSGNDCIESKTLTELAGGDDNFGAVGIPDRGSLVPVNKAHCDSGDYFDIDGYPHAKAAAQGALEECRDWMREKLNEAVRDSADLVDADGNLRAARSRGTPSAMRSKTWASCSTHRRTSIPTPTGPTLGTRPSRSASRIRPV
jgi:hypothetical protein